MIGDSRRLSQSRQERAMSGRRIVANRVFTGEEQPLRVAIIADGIREQIVIIACKSRFAVQFANRISDTRCIDADETVNAACKTIRTPTRNHRVDRLN
jgi:hypothetical protein